MKFNTILETIKKTWTNSDLSDSWEGELLVGNIVFYVTTDYDADYTIDDGDEYTPPDTTITNIQLNNTKIVQYNPNDNKEYEITEETDPLLVKVILSKVELEIEDDIYNYHLSR